MGAPNGRVDQVTWDKLLEAYRQDPGNHSNAARYAMVQRRTARRAWDVGYPATAWGSKPIRVILQEDIEIARSRTQLEQERAQLSSDQADLDAERDREAARQLAIQTKQQEALVVGGARAAAMKGLAAVIAAAPGIKDAMMRLGTELTAISSGAPITHKEMVAISSIGRRYAATLRDLSAAGQMALEMERLRLGEPQEIIGVQTELDTMPIEDLVRMAGYQDGVLKRAADRGLIVLDGGQAGRKREG